MRLDLLQHCLPTGVVYEAMLQGREREASPGILWCFSPWQDMNVCLELSSFSIA